MCGFSFAYRTVASTIFARALGNQLRQLGIGIAQICIQGVLVEPVTLTLHFSQMGPQFFGNGRYFLGIPSEDLQAVRIAGPAVAHLVIQQASSGNFIFKAQRQGPDGLHGKVFLFVIGARDTSRLEKILGNIKLDEVAVHQRLGDKINDILHIIVGVASLQTNTSVTAGRSFTQSYTDVFQCLLGNPLPFHARAHPITSQLPKQPIYGNQHTAGIGTGNIAAAVLNFNCHCIIQCFIFHSGKSKQEYRDPDKPKKQRQPKGRPTYLFYQKKREISSVNFNKKSQKYFVEQQNRLAKLNGVIEESYSGQTVIKTYNAKQEFKDKFEKVNDKLYQSGWKAQFASGTMHPIMGFVGNLGKATAAQIQELLQKVSDIVQDASGIRLEPEIRIW